MLNTEFKAKLIGGWNPTNDSTVKEANELCSQLAKLLDRPKPSLSDNATPEYMALYETAINDILSLEMLMARTLTFRQN
jgi:hypothetical protein